MAKLGSDKRPAVVRVNSVTRAEEIVAYCNERGWKVIVGVEPEETEDLADLEKLGGGTRQTKSPNRSEPRIGRNEPCPCGSGKKYKKCCGRGNVGFSESDGGLEEGDSGWTISREESLSFIPIGLDDYIQLHLKRNPGESVVELRSQLNEMIDLIKAGQRCACGEKPWAIGSALAGLACFTCITGDATPSGDYELSEVLDVDV